jgi:hypothetical protein
MKELKASLPWLLLIFLMCGSLLTLALFAPGQVRKTTSPVLEADNRACASAQDYNQCLERLGYQFVWEEVK